MRARRMDVDISVRTSQHMNCFVLKLLGRVTVCLQVTVPQVSSSRRSVPVRVEHRTHR